MKTLLHLVALAPLLVFTPVAHAEARGPQITVEYRASYPANFLWLVNTLAGDAHSNTEAFQAYWRRIGCARPDDEAQLAVFRQVRDRYHGEYLPAPSDERFVVPVSPNEGDLHQRCQSIFLSSSTMDEAWSKAEVLLTDADRERLQAVFAHFQPGFEAHWKRCGYLHDYRARFVEYARSHELSALLGDAARFLGVPDQAALPVRVIFLFTPSSQHTYGRAVGRDLVVEVPEGQGPEAQVDVVVHELCHYFYDRGGVEHDAAFMTRFFGTGDRHAGPAWGLLNEGLATAIGEGLAMERLAPDTFTRTLSKPLGWYNDDRIDRFAKALYPDLREAIRAGRTFRDLSPAMLSAYDRALGHRSDDPKTYLASYCLVDGFSRRQGFERYFKQVPPRSVWHSTFASAPRMLERYPAQTVVVAAQASDLPAIEASAEAYGISKEQHAALRRYERAILVVRRPVNGYLFLVYGRTPEALDEAMARFGGLDRFNEGLAPL